MGESLMNKTLYLAKREEESFQRHCRLAKFLMNNSMHIFDIGANIGQSVARYREQYPNCIVTSFEPNPVAFSLLEKNWAGIPGITLNRLALSNYIGEASFYATHVSEASSLLKPTEHIMNLSSEHKYDYETISVLTTTLDHYCHASAIKNIDILKLDVQGSEFSVLQGAEKLLQAGMIRLIYSEITFAETYTNQTSYTDLISYLCQFNYTLWDIGSFLYTRNDRLWAGNLTFVHASAADFIETNYNAGCH
jgi:FkbM family methyltransferase